MAEPTGPYFNCCAHCEHGDDGPPDLHEVACPEGCNDDEHQEVTTDEP